MQRTLTQQEIKQFHALQEDRKDSNRVYSKPSSQGLWSIVKGMYSEQAHFIFELLQNANDTQATRVRFRLFPEGLFFAHDGTVHFSVSDPQTANQDKNNGKLGHINAITSIGNSTKKGAEIGKFGIGFKSVFQYTSTPEIYDPPFFFRLENYIVPVRLKEDHPQRRKNETLFFFPFNLPQKSAESSYKEILKKLENLGYPNLFLSHVHEIDWETEDGASGNYRKEVLEDETVDQLHIQKIRYTQYQKGGKVSHYLRLFSDTIIQPGNKTAFPYSLGFFTLENGEIEVPKHLPVYCYFPTQVKPNLPFILHAPFLLTDNREGIKEGEKWNNNLIDELSKLLCRTLCFLRDRKELTPELFATLPFDPERISDERFLKFYDHLLRLLKKGARLLPTPDGRYTQRQRSILGESQRLIDLLSTQQIRFLSQKKSSKVNWILPRINRNANGTLGSLFVFLNKTLGIEEYTVDKFFNDLTKEFMQKANEEWVGKFYLFLFRHKRLWPEVRRKPIILTEKGKFVSAVNEQGEANVYLPHEEKRNTPYPTVKKAFTKDSQLLSLFKGLGIEKPEKEAEITYYVLPDYQKPPLSKSEEDYFNDLRLIISYYYSLGIYEKQSFLNRLSQHYIIQVNQGLGSKSTWIRPSEVQVYDKADVNNQFFAPYQSNGGKEVYWLDRNLYGSRKKNKSIFKFLDQLGIARSPKIETTLLIEGGTDPRWRSFLKEKGLEKIKVTKKIRAKDKTLLGLGDYLRSIKNFQESRFLWQRLRILYDEGLRDSRENIFQGIYTYYRRIEKKEFFDSEILTLLKTHAWLFSVSGQRFRPSEISVEELDQYPHIAEVEGMIKDLGVGTSSYTSIDDIPLPDNLRKDLEYMRRFREAGIDEAELDAFIKEKRRKALERSSVPQRKKDRTQLVSRKSNFQETPSEDQGSDVDDYNPRPEKTEEFKQKLEKKKRELEVEFEAEQIKLKRITEFERIAKSSKRYSFGWMKAMLNLEVIKSVESSSDSQTLRIRFNEVWQDPNSSRTLILKEPNRYIPSSIEDLGDLPLRIHMKSENRLLKVEVVSTKERALSARMVSEEALSALNTNEFLYAEIEIKDPIFLLEALRNQFKDLPFNDGDSLRDGLPEQIEFVFGPPGTGKTTHLAKRLLIKSAFPQHRTLVLAPTNKAADVLARKIMSLAMDDSYTEWLFRFGTTSDLEIEKSGILIDKKTNILSLQNMVVVTTMARLPYDGFEMEHGEGGLLRNIAWDNVVFDEASMISLPYILYAIHQLKGNKDYCEFLIAGDPFQIQPVIHLEEWKDENIYSLVELNNFRHPTTKPHDFEIEKLTTQYRSIPSIGRLFSELTYGGVLAHKRSESDQRVLSGKDWVPGSLTLIDFPVNSSSGIYKSMRLAGKSSYHVYSAILAVELAAYISELVKKDKDIWRLGIICPYKAQAQMTERLAERKGISHSKFRLICDTVHGFQGDECEIIIALLNPPPGMSTSKRSFVNKQNILNVAISRPRDYLIIMSPDKDTKNIENLWLIQQLKKKAKKKHSSQVKEISSKELENHLFNQSDFIYENAFATSHQQVNIYGQPDYLYEVRLNDEAIDIQLKS